jgi:exodeoxyribonuclease VII large subunit
VARALASSRVPTISAVGHETDFTIADFVADLRAPTPSAAAECVVQAKEDLQARIHSLDHRLSAAVELRFTRVRARLESLTSHRVFTAERGRIRTAAQRVDDLLRRGEAGLVRRIERARDRMGGSASRLEAFRWDRQLENRRERLARGSERLSALARRGFEARRARLAQRMGQLESLSPLAVLARGYALVWDEGRLVRSPADIAVGDRLKIRVHDGSFDATVTRKEPQ